MSPYSKLNNGYQPTMYFGRTVFVDLDFRRLLKIIAFEFFVSDFEYNKPMENMHLFGIKICIFD